MGLGGLKASEATVMHASFRYASRSCSCFVRAKFEQVPALNRHLRSLTMSANVLSSSENLQPAASTKQGAAAAMEPPSKQPRLEQPSTFKVKLLNEDAKAPQRGSAAAAGYDLCRLVTIKRDSNCCSCSCGTKCT